MLAACRSSACGARGSGPCVLHIRFARASELADACVSVHSVVALWPMASGPIARLNTFVRDFGSTVEPAHASLCFEDDKVT